MYDKLKTTHPEGRVNIQWSDQAINASLQYATFAYGI